MSKLKNFLFKNNGVRQTAIKNTLWLSIGQIGSRLLRAVVIIFAARVLGAEGYGVFAYILSLAGFFTIFADIGVSQILTREVSKKPKEENRYFASSLAIKLFLISLVSIIVLFFSPHLTDLEAVKMLMPFAALLVIFDSLRDFVNAYFRGKEKMEMEALTTTVSNIAITIFGLIVVFSWPVPGFVTAAYVWAAGFGTVLGIYLLRDKFLNFFKDFDAELVKPIIKASWPIALSSALGAFMLNIDVIMIGFFHGAEEVGLYAASEKIIGLLYILPALLAAALFPIISRYVEKGDNKRSARVVEKGLLATFMVALPVCIGGGLLASDIINLLYGSEYVVGRSVLALKILLFTPLIIYPGALLKNYILAYDKQIKMVPIVGLGAFANILLNIVLIPNFGIVGSAISTIMATGIMYGGVWILANQVNPFFMFTRLYKPVLAAAVMGVFVYVFDVSEVHLLINISVSALIYFGALFLMNDEVVISIKESLLKD